MKISCIIVDDEPLARKGLAEYVGEVDFLNLKAVCENAIAAASVIAQQKIDLIFLDIQMPKMSGIEFLRSLHTQPLIIFTTAYSEYALKGYELNVLDYLVKPIPFERFFKAVNKAKEFYSLKNIPSQEAGKPAGYFFIRCDNQYEKIMLDEVLFVQALENYVVIQTGNKKYITYLTLKNVEEYVPTDRFIKVHKSYIVSIAKVEKIVGNEMKIGSYSIPISRNLKEEVMNRVVNDKLLKR